jgi:predicted nuclease with TOPRIM domain
MQLDDYDNISHSLLTDNIETQEKIKKLTGSVDDLKQYSEELQQKINILYSIIDTREIEIELLEESCIPKVTLTKDQTQSIDSVIDNENHTTNEPKITLENENEVTGF